MIELRAVRGKTGRLLAQLLIEKQVNLTQGEPEGIISYGVPVKSDLPTLNANAGRLNKFEELQALAKAGIPVPTHRIELGEQNERMLGRSFKHARGKDIRIMDGRATPPGRSDFYTTYIPQSREYRVWVFRSRVLGVYEKHCRYPRRAKRRPGIAWNWSRGFAFSFYKDAPQELKDLGMAAVKAVGLDFAAVDIIQNTNGKLFVLECNSAPGVRERRQGISYLATKLARWTTNGFKERRKS